MAKKTVIPVEVLFSTKGGTDFANQVGAALSKAGKSWQSELRSGMAEAIEAANLYAFTSGKSGSAIKQFIKSNLTTPYKEAMKAIRRNDVEAAQKYTDILDKRSKAFKKELDAMTAAQERVARRKDRTGAEKADDVGKALQTRSAGGLLDLFRGKGGQLQDLGKSRQLEAGKMGQRAQAMGGAEGAQAAAKAAQMAKMGASLAKVGAAMATIAAVAGVILIVVKAFLDLEQVIKDMNKELLNTASTADFAFTTAEVEAGAYKKTLASMVNDLSGLNDNMRDFGATAQEQRSVIARLNEAGFTFREMRQSFKDTNSEMRNYEDVASTVLQYARAIGVESGQMAQTMGDLTLRSTLDLQQVGEQFSIITREAERAGFQTKRFYSAVVEATSGMAFYGVRIEETAQLLTAMGGLIGQVYGEDMMKRVGQKYGNSYEKMLETVLLQGDETMTKAYQRAFTMKLSQTERDLGMEGIDEMIKSAGTLSEFYKMMRESNPGLSGEQLDELQHLFTLKQAAEGNQTAQMAAGKMAGPAFGAIMDLTNKLPLKDFGGNVGEAFSKILDDRNSGAAVALEKLSEESGQSLQALIDLGVASSGSTDILKEMAAAGDAVPEWATKLGITFQNGVPMKGETEIKDWDDLFAIQVESRKEQKDAMLSEYDLTKAMFQETVSTNALISEGILGILVDIYQGVMEIVALLSFGKSDAQKEQARRESMGKAAEKDTAYRKKIEDKANKSLEDAQKKSATATTPEEKKAARVREELAKEDRSKAEQERERSEAAQKALQYRVTDREAKDSGMFMAMQRQLPENLQLDERAAKGTQAVLGGITREDRIGWIMDMKRSGREGALVGDRSNKAVGHIKGTLKDQGHWEDLAKQMGGEDRLEEAMREAAKLTDANTSWYTSATGVYEEALNNVQKMAGAYSSFGVQGEGYTAKVSYEDRLRGRAAEYQEGNVMAAPVGHLIESGLDALDAIKAATAETADATQTGVALDVSGAKGVQDLILPSGGGRPIITDPSDMLMAFKPGGPISQALGAGGGGGRGGGAVNVNIYGGDLNEVYREVMRVMKVLGKA